jgi:murein DD-endopeptidase MepM/ murein hydrolase activator NlpD
MATARAIGHIADRVREAAAEAGVDPFLLGALVYRASRCNPQLHTPFGIGLLQIQPHMYAANLRAGKLVYQVRAGEAWADKTRPLPRGGLHPVLLAEPRHHLRVGAALLGMWQDQHPGIDQVFAGSVPHRGAVAHFGWGDVVRGTGGEDRALVARRRLIEHYLDKRPAPHPTSLGIAVVSPLQGTPRVAPSGPGEDRALVARRRLIEHYLDKRPAPHPTSLGIAVVSPLQGTPRVAPSGPGEDRDEGARAHRGLDIDATTGEPVGSLADGVVWFAGFDLPGRVRPQPVPPEELAHTPRPPLGAGGLFVCVRHTEGIFSCYMHLSSYRVHINDRVKAGDCLGAVGRSGVKSSGSHLHLEIHVKGEAVDPAPILGPELVIPPQDTVAHDLAMQSKKLRLKHERRARWRAHLAARREMAARPK